MMKLLQKLNQADLEGVVSGCLVTVLDDDGRTLSKMFDHGDPTAAEIEAAFPQAARFVPASKAGWERTIKHSYEFWQLWKNTHAEAVLRGASANLLAALSVKTEAAWTAYVADLQAWRAAT